MARMGSKEGRAMRARRQFTDEFNPGAVRMVLDEGKTVAQVARDLDLTQSAPSGWVRRARADRDGGKSGLTTEERTELAKLLKENRELKMERELLKNGRRLLRQGKRVKYAFIEAEKAFASVAWMCRRLGVSTSGFYAWRRRPHSKREAKDEQLRVAIKVSFDQSRQTYGSPRVLEDLREDGEKVGRNRVIRLMQQEGLRARARKRFKCTTKSDHGQPVADNVLARQFEADEPNQRWVGDTTEMLTSSGGKFYLAAIIDLFSGMCVGWAVSAVNDRHLTMRALDAAIRRRCPETGLLHHSDQGSKYASEDYQALLAAHGIECSTSRRGNCLDNAAMESWFSTVKFELGETFASIAHGKEQLFDYIEVFYNQRRQHSALDYVSAVRARTRHRTSHGSIGNLSTGPDRAHLLR